MAPEKYRTKHEQFTLWEGAKTLLLLCTGLAFYMWALVLEPESAPYLSVVAFIGGSIGAVMGHCCSGGSLRKTVNWAVVGALVVWIPVIATVIAVLFLFAGHH